MKVLCISNKGSYLPKSCLDKRSGFTRETEFHLIEGKEYTVYGITLFLGHIWYYLCDEAYSYYPIWNPSPLFKVTDERISRYWVYGHTPRTSQATEQVLFAFPEWVNDPYFYDQLTEGIDKYKEIFAKYKKLMDLEFPDTSIQREANLLKNNWVMCPNCDESWEVTNQNRMLKCPNCHKIMHNPIYEE